jgi:hypothetical protein
MVWCDVESDPAVFRELIARFGVKGVGVEEIYDLSMKADPSFGLILLFKYIREVTHYTHYTCYKRYKRYTHYTHYIHHTHYTHYTHYTLYTRYTRCTHYTR